MPAASLESTLECGRRRCGRPSRVSGRCLLPRVSPLPPTLSWTGCSAMSGARPAGCAPRRRRPGSLASAGHPGPQALGCGSAARCRVRLRRRDARLDPDAALVIDETGFLKQGKASCGCRSTQARPARSPTARSACLPPTSRVKATPSSTAGSTYPRPGLRIRAGWRAAHVPEAVTFATKPRLALAMIERAIQAEVPFAWGAADSVYGVGEIELALRRAYKGYVLGVDESASLLVLGRKPRARALPRTSPRASPDQDWLRLSAGAGSKGPACSTGPICELATLRADALDAALDQSLWTRGLLVRRGVADGALAYFTTWCPAGTPVEKLVDGRGRRWAIEDGVRDCQERNLGWPTTRAARGTVGTGTSAW